MSLKQLSSQQNQSTAEHICIVDALLIVTVTASDVHRSLTFHKTMHWLRSMLFELCLLLDGGVKHGPPRWPFLDPWAQAPADGDPNINVSRSSTLCTSQLFGAGTPILMTGERCFQKWNQVAMSGHEWPDLVIDVVKDGPAGIE